MLKICALNFLQGKGDGLPIMRSGLHDNWDDPVGYYCKYSNIWLCPVCYCFYFSILRFPSLVLPKSYLLFFFNLGPEQKSTF